MGWLNKILGCSHQWTIWERKEYEYKRLRYEKLDPKLFMILTTNAEENKKLLNEMVVYRRTYQERVCTECGKIQQERLDF